MDAPVTDKEISDFCSEEQAIKDEFAKLVSRMQKLVFISGAKDPMQLKSQELSALGMLMVRYCEYDLDAVLLSVESAMVDVNYDHLVTDIQRIRAKIGA